jgi:hypothetical protein
MRNPNERQCRPRPQPDARSRRARPARGLAQALEARQYLAGVLSIGDAAVAEGDSGNPALVFTIDWVGTLGDADSCFFDIATSDGTASAAQGDYVPVTQRIDFLPFTSHRKQFRVTVNADTRDESDETVQVTLSNAVNAVIADGAGIGTIIEDDDHRPTVAITPLSPPFRDTPVASMDIRFTEPVFGFEVSDLSLTRDGGANLLTAAQSLTTADSITWTLGGLSGLTNTHGDYTLTVRDDPAVTGIADADLNPLSGGATTAWANIVAVDPGPGPVVPDGPEFRVNTHTPDVQTLPATAMDSAGDFVVVWQSRAQDQPTGTAEGVYGQRYDSSGTPRGAEFLVNNTVLGNQMRPQVATDAAGNFVVVWESPDASGVGIFARRYDAAGVPQGAEFGVNATTAGPQTYPVVAMDADGEFVVAWVSFGQDLPGTDGVYAQRYSKSGVALGGEFRVNTRVASQQRFPTVAMSAAGDFVVAWSGDLQDPDNSTGIYAQRYDAAGATRGGEFRVNAYTVSDQFEPAAAMDADGDFVVTWHGYEQGGNYGVFARRFDSTGAAGAEIDVSTTLPGFQRYAAVAMDADGDFVVTWQDEHSGPTPGFTTVTAQRFDPAGARVGGEFVVNSTNVGHHRYPAAAMDADGDFVIAWAGYGQDPGDNANTSGVYAQRYSRVQAPRVTQVYARGTTWSAPFMAYLEAQGLGSSRYGFAVGGGAGQLATLPWRNVNQLSVTFSRPVAAEQRHLAVRGVNVPAYAVSSFAYDPATRTATWTLAQDVGKDKLNLDLDGDGRTGGVAGTESGTRLLDGEWTTGGAFPSGDGAAGGDFRYRINVLPGDVNRSGSVLADDFSAVKSRFFRSTTAPGPAPSAYTLFHDVDGSGSVLADDFSVVKSRFFNALPGPEPAAVLTAIAATSRPPRRMPFA